MERLAFIKQNFSIRASSSSVAMTFQLAMSITSPLDGARVKRLAIGRDRHALAAVSVVDCVCWQIKRLLGGRRSPTELFQFELRDLDAARSDVPYAAPGSCQ